MPFCNASSKAVQPLEMAVIVDVSGYGRVEDCRHADESSFDDHPTKPLDYDARLSSLSAGGEARS